MKVLFVYSRSDSPSGLRKPVPGMVAIQLGISYVSQVLKDAGHTTKLFVPVRSHYQEGVAKALATFTPEVICFTAVSTKYPFIQEVAEAFRRLVPGACLVIGGPHTSLNPAEVISGPFDAICIGEGERPMADLLEMLSQGEKPAGIPNLWIKHEDGIDRNETRPFVENLDELPFPDREMWRSWVDTSDTRHIVLLGRGCPYNCSYCSNHALRRLQAGRYVRLRSTGSVADEIRQICRAFPEATHFSFEVETIGVDTAWALDLSDRLVALNAERSVPLTFETNLRVTRGRSFATLFTALKRAGFTAVRIGIESGSERLRKDVLRRDYGNEDLIRVCDEAHSAGLAVNAFNMLGLPGETPEDFWETVTVNRRVLPEANSLSIFYPYPGTDLYKLCLERGLNVAFDHGSLERDRAVLGLPEFPDRLVNRYYRWFDWYVYKGKWPARKILFGVAARAIRSHPRLLRFCRSVMGGTLVTRLRK